MSAVRPAHPLASGRAVERAELWTFPEGLIGLPDFREFALLPIENGAPFEILCSAEDDFGLVIVNPVVFVPDYTLALTPGDIEPLGTTNPDQIQIRVPIVLPMDGQPFSLNLKGPIVLCPGSKKGAQRISPDESHPVRFTPNQQDPASCSS